MIYQGKIMYLLQQILPEEKGYRLLGFTAEQEEWCRNNEEQIWRFLIENDYLFSTQQRIMTKYLNDAPLHRVCLSNHLDVQWCGQDTVLSENICRKRRMCPWKG